MPSKFECFICGAYLQGPDQYDMLKPENGIYLELPSGLVVYSCHEHVCEHGKFKPDYYLSHLLLSDLDHSIRSYASQSPIAKQIVNQLLQTINEWQNPCYTCLTSW